MHLDATGLPVLARKEPGGKKLGSLWGYIGDTTTAAVIYTSTGKRDGQRPGEIGPAQMLAKRRGYVVADASGLFDSSFNREGPIECGCNMHARRYFHKALEVGDHRAALPLAPFKKLYEIEERIRECDAATRRQARQAESRPVYDELQAWCEVYKPHEPPSSAMGAAIRYLTNHQTALPRFMDDGVNPVEYLADVLPRLARTIRLGDVPAMLPKRRIAEQPLPNQN